MSTKLFVGNLSFTTTLSGLQDAFAVHGGVLAANLVMDHATGRARGFGFVTMSSAAEAQAAITALNGAQLDGRPLTVNEAHARDGRGTGDGRREYTGAGRNERY